MAEKKVTRVDTGVTRRAFSGQKPSRVVLSCQPSEWETIRSFVSPIAETAIQHREGREFRIARLEDGQEPVIALKTRYGKKALSDFNALYFPPPAE